MQWDVIVLNELLLVIGNLAAMEAFKNAKSEKVLKLVYFGSYLTEWFLNPCKNESP